ncbi:MAG: cupin domain-containing protein [Kiloniellales bacterium]|nr:cupin domain-containing protein [Kiloniellales bacterium]
MTAPEKLPYRISGRDIVADLKGMRVQVLSLAVGETIPWHFHSEVNDVFICLDGILRVETKAPSCVYELKPGNNCIVLANTAHLVSGNEGKACRFVLVQGVGQHDFIPVGAKS